MEWTYSVYNGCNAGISLGLAVIIGSTVFITFYSSKTGQKFVTERVIGVDPPEWEGDEEQTTQDESSAKVPNCFRSRLESSKFISSLLCLLGAMTLSITAVLIFQGCFLANMRLLPNQNCPDMPMDCFIFNQSARNPINQSASFKCQPANKTQFPDGLFDPIAMCYGWIIQFQSPKSILDQLGVCTGLIGLSTSLLAIIVYLGRTKKNLLLCSTLIIPSIVTFSLLIIYKWSFAPLSFAVLSLGLALGAFGLLFYYISPKPKPTKATLPVIPLSPNPPSVRSDVVESVPNPSSPTMETQPRRTVIGSARSSKVSPA